MIVGSIQATVIALTTCPAHPSSTLLTVEIDIPRYLLAQMNTHRMLSKNTQSSRAVPFERMVEEVPTYIPSIVGVNRKGMTCAEYLSGQALLDFQAEWLRAYEKAVQSAKNLAHYEKGIINRLLEPFKFTRQILTGTVSPRGWLNFFLLRSHGDAQSEMQVLSKLIESKLKAATAQLSPQHIPYSTDLRTSAVRCATVSYRREEPPDVAKVYGQLIAANPPHSSVFEHQGLCPKSLTPEARGRLYPRQDYKANFSDACFYQYRKLLESKVLNP